jgi:hypothetical protein
MADSVNHFSIALGSPEAATINHFSVSVDVAVMAPDIAEDDADSNINLGLPVWDFSNDPRAEL